MPASVNSSRPTTPAEPSISVEVATEHDRDHLSTLILNAVEHVHGSRGANARLAHLGYPSESLPGSLFLPSGPVLLVARIDGGICGFAALSRNMPRLQALFVDPKYRRQGVGRALVTAAEAAARARGGSPLSAMVAAGSRSEKSLFEALGYRAELLVMEPRDDA